MSSISNRVDKLEREQLDAAIARALSPQDMTDRQLLEAILEQEGVQLSADELDAQIPQFRETGALPGLPGVTLEDLAARGRPINREED